jgi:hypothetical protein
LADFITAQITCRLLQVCGYLVVRGIAAKVGNIRPSFAMTPLNRSTSFSISALLKGSAAIGISCS